MGMQLTWTRDSMKRLSTTGLGLVIGFVLAGPTEATVDQEPAPRGLVVVNVRAGSALAELGLQTRDILLSWQRLANPPAYPEQAQGTLSSIADWRKLLAEEASLGTIRLTALRDGEIKIFELAPGAWGDQLKVVEQGLYVTEAITILSASRHRERIVEAPAAVTYLPGEEIERQAAIGQLPKLLEFTAGVEVTQTGIFSFNFNTRGLNAMINRRILTLVDGRDPSVPLSGNMEWITLSSPFEDIASIELVRGPGSALYGSDAFNGVLNLTTRAPRDSQGYSARLALGELQTQRLEMRVATGLGHERYFKLLGSHTESDGFAVSRNNGVEYSVPCPDTSTFDCIPTEATALEHDKLTSLTGSMRLDNYIGDDLLTFEAGLVQHEGVVVLTSVGRFQLLPIDQPWARINYNTSQWNLQANYTGGDFKPLQLAADIATSLDGERFNAAFQGHTAFAGSKGFLVGGVAYTQEDVNSEDPFGNQTFIVSRKKEDFEAVFGLVEYSLTDKVKASLAVRWDDSTLYDAQLSPRASFVYAAHPRHYLRFSYSKAFQAPVISDFFLFIDLAKPIDLQFLEPICTLGGTSCGFDQPVRILAVGNEGLKVEEVQALELGYSGTFGKKILVRADFYESNMKNFLTDLIGFQNETLGGSFNDTYLPYTPPSNLAATQSTLLIETLQSTLPPELFAIMSNGPEGEPLFTALTYANFAVVDNRGFDLSILFSINDQWNIDASYTHSDFDVKQQLPEDPILPNSSENRFTFGVTYVGERLDASFRYRHTEEFNWKSGFFRGVVPSYGVASFTANYSFTPRLKGGIDISNVFDDKHFEAFGGDLIGRLAMGHISISW